jgi:hypothetical protein
MQTKGKPTFYKLWMIFSVDGYYYTQALFKLLYSIGIVAGHKIN